MSSELERQLEGFFSELPEPNSGVGETALAASLTALRPATPRRALRTGVLAVAAAVVLLAIAAGSLAAAGALHVSFGHKFKPRPVTGQLRLPSGTDGIDAIVDGRLSLVTKSGFRLQGLPVSSAALSPHALYVAAGIGRSLVALGPGGRAWSHPAGGVVVGIAWAPFGNRIAYVVHAGHRFVLHVIWGNGTNDSAIDRSVRAVRPSWRADSLAFAYVGAGGRAIVYDLAHLKRRIVAVHGVVAGVSFAPRGNGLAVYTGRGVWLASRDARVTPRAVEAFGWEHDNRLAVVVPTQVGTTIEQFSSTGAPRGTEAVRGTVVAVDPKLFVVQRQDALIAGDTTLLTLAPGATVSQVEIR